MSTDAEVGIIRGGRAVESIFVRMGGLPEEMGQLLIDKYQSTERVEALVDMGWDFAYIPKNLDGLVGERPDCYLQQQERGGHYESPQAFQDGHRTLHAYLWNGGMWFHKDQRWEDDDHWGWTPMTQEYLNWYHKRD